MTMPVPSGTRIVDLPPPQFPMLMMMFTDKLIPDSSPESVLQWVIMKPHPYDANVKVFRMFADDDGVEVYSASNDGTVCMRDFIQMRYVRFTRETMPIEIFVEELESAQYDSEDDEPDPEPDPEPEPEIIAPNGQASS